MHVGFRSSGGRGEYELVGRHGELSASQLSDWILHWDLPDLGRRVANLKVSPGGSGKARLRRISGTGPQIGRQVAALLLLPPPRRTRDGLSSGIPVTLDGGYRVSKIGIRTDSTFDVASRIAAIKPGYVEVENAADTDILGFDSRWQRIRSIHTKIARLPEPIADAVGIYRAFLHDGTPGDELLTALQRIISALDEATASNDHHHDILAALESLLGLQSPEAPALPQPTLVEHDAPEVRIRAASEWRAVRSRGHSATRFSRLVRAAYDNTCAFCGLSLPGSSGIQSGVDAAHILPWSEYDLDVVSNGLCLCKMHHWAFDQAILRVDYIGKTYHVNATLRLETFDEQTQSYLRRAVGRIPEQRLPVLPSNRPNHEFLDILNGTITSSLAILDLVDQPPLPETN